MKHFVSSRTNDKNGFTLVELLVVILIIGILAAVAIPAFLEQRQRANDATVESDARAVRLAIETWAVENPNDRVPVVSWKSGSINVGSETVTLSDGVYVRYGHLDGVYTDRTGTYYINAYHTNGKQYTGDPSSPAHYQDSYRYDSVKGVQVTN